MYHSVAGGYGGAPLVRPHGRRHMSGLGADTAQMGSGTSWVAGGLLVGLAVVIFAIDAKDPLGLRGSR